HRFVAVHVVQVILPVGAFLEVRIIPVEFRRTFQHRVSAAAPPLLGERVFVATPEEVSHLGRGPENVRNRPIWPRAPLRYDPTPFDPVPTFVPVPAAGVWVLGRSEFSEPGRAF